MIVLRHATARERETLVRRQWINRCSPRATRGEVGPHGVAFGRRGHYVSVSVARRMVELVVADLLGTGAVEVVVAELHAPGMEPEVLGWIAYDSDVVHFVCVPSGYGRRGVGTALLRHAGTSGASWSTPNGRALAQALGDEEQAA